MVCNHCGLVFQSPRMTAAELDRFYEREYRLMYHGDEGPTGKDLFVQTGRAEHALDFLAKHVTEIHSHLDIGSSAGVLLQKFKSHFNCRITGVEPGEQYRNYSKQQGLSVFASLEDLEKANAGPADLVSMMHVLEHLPDPVKALADLREKHLAAGGWLLVEVPNLFSHDSFETAHMTSFSRHTLVQVLHQAGFEIQHMKAHGAPRSAILPLYLTLLARPNGNQEPGPVRPESFVEIKRRAGMTYRRILQRIMPDSAWRALPGE